MAKLSLTDTSAGYLNATTANANNDLIEAAVENTLSRDGTSPNTLSADIDMNSNRVTNLTDGSNNQDAVTVAQLNGATLAGTGVITAGTMDSESSTDGHVLTSDGAAGAAWEAAAGGGLSNVVEDTTPQLGGNLDLNSSDITGTGDITITGNVTATGEAEVAGAAPILSINETDAGSDLKDWRLYASGGLFYFTTRDDADSTGELIFRVGRTGTTPDSLLMGTQLSMSDNAITKPHLHEYYLVSNSLTPTGTTASLPYSASATGGNAHEIDLASATGTVTATLSGIDSGAYAEMIVKVTQDATTPRDITWAHATGSFVWPSGSTPVVSTGALAVDIFTFKTWDGGTTIYGNVSQDYS